MNKLDYYVLRGFKENPMTRCMKQYGLLISDLKKILNMSNFEIEYLCHVEDNANFNLFEFILWLENFKLMKMSELIYQYAKYKDSNVNPPF